MMRITRYGYEEDGRLEAFYASLQRDVKLFVFILLTLCIYRAYFMYYMAGYMTPGTGTGDIALALITGLRLSFKTAGAAVLPAFLLCTLPVLISPQFSRVLGRLRLAWGTLAIFVFAVLFQARFPFYRQFQSTFHMQVAAGLHDDVTAIFMTMLQEYGLLWRLGIALLLTLVSFVLLRYLLCSRGTYPLPRLWGLQRMLFACGLVVLIAAVSVFLRFGGSFTYGSGVNWENAGVTRDMFLNECILDDGQALYRARAMQKRIAGGDITARGIVLPAFTLAVVMSAKYTRQVRTAVLEELGQDYVIGAKARGLSMQRILWRHVLPNACLPLVTLLGLAVGWLLGGVAVIEMVFSWPGLGKMAVHAIEMRDYPLVQGFVLWIAILYMLINLLVDISYAQLDPRLKRGGR